MSITENKELCGKMTLVSFFLLYTWKHALCCLPVLSLASHLLSCLCLFVRYMHEVFTRISLHAEASLYQVLPPQVN